MRQPALEVGAGQVVQEQVVAEVKQVASLLGQVFFDGGLVGFDQAEAAIEMVERQAGAGANASSSGKAVLGSQWKMPRSLRGSTRRLTAMRAAITAMGTRVRDCCPAGVAAGGRGPGIARRGGRRRRRRAGVGWHQEMDVRA